MGLKTSKGKKVFICLFAFCAFYAITWLRLHFAGLHLV